MGAAQVTDIGPLAGHDALRVLDLSSNAITDVSPLAGLANLDTLRLAQNGVVDPTRRQRAGRCALLQELQVGANPLPDLTPLLRSGRWSTSGWTRRTGPG